MVSRIKQLLEWQQLSPTQFADRIGVGRPVVSHILSERNKPSLEVVQRIIAAFPELSLPWLLSGTGQMLANDALQTPPPPAKPPAVVTAAESSSVAATATAPTVGPKPIPRATTPEMVTNSPPATNVARPAVLSRPAMPRFQLTKLAPTITTEPTATQVATPGPAAPVAEQLAPPVPPVTVAPATPGAAPVAANAPEVMNDTVLTSVVESGKAIRRIVIFYRDGSFVDYQPEA